MGSSRLKFSFFLWCDNYIKLRNPHGAHGFRTVLLTLELVIWHLVPREQTFGISSGFFFCIFSDRRCRRVMHACSHHTISPLAALPSASVLFRVYAIAFVTINRFSGQILFGFCSSRTLYLWPFPVQYWVIIAS